MNRSLFSQEILPFFMMFFLLIAVAFLFDGVLHYYDFVWVGRWLGIPGTFLIVVSLIYSLRKRRIIQIYSPKSLLSLHEFLAWIGALFILVHAGIHLYAILPWLALLAMLVNVISGMTGKYLLNRSRKFLSEKRDHYRDIGLGESEIERRLFRDATAFELMKNWRVIHLPISMAFAVLSLVHITSVLLFWEWK